MFELTDSAAGDSANFSSTFSVSSPAFTPIGAGSLTYNNKDYKFDRSHGERGSRALPNLSYRRDPWLK